MPDASAPESKTKKKTTVSLQKRPSAEPSDTVEATPGKSRKVEGARGGADNKQTRSAGDNKEACKSEKGETDTVPSAYAKQYTQAY